MEKSFPQKRGDVDSKLKILTAFHRRHSPLAIHSSDFEGVNTELNTLLGPLLMLAFQDRNGPHREVTDKLPLGTKSLYYFFKEDEAGIPLPK